jgi:hypothetical protein
MVVKKDFAATVLNFCWRSVVFITPRPIRPQNRHLYLLNRWLGRPNSQNECCGKEKKKYLVPIIIQKCERLPTAYSLISYAIPGPTAISKFLRMNCMTFQSHCITGEGKVNENDKNYYTSTQC